jgi:hypothetical protein
MKYPSDAIYSFAPNSTIIAPSAPMHTNNLKMNSKMNVRIDLATLYSFYF